jgi:DNA repair protein RecN (Recombination protein N)
LRKDSDAALAAPHWRSKGAKLSTGAKSFPHFEQLGLLLADWACPTPASWCSTAPARQPPGGIDVVSILFTANKGAQLNVEQRPLRAASSRA